MTVEVSELNNVNVLEDMSKSWGENYLGWIRFEKGSEEGLGFKVPDNFPFEGKLIEAREEHKFFNAIRFPVMNLKTTVLFDFKNIDVVAWEKGSVDFESKRDDFKKFISSKYPPYFKTLDKFSQGKMTCSELEKKLGKVVSFLNWDDALDFPNGIPTVGMVPGNEEG